MPKFIAVRHGSNGANQRMQLRKVIAVVIAPDEDSARDSVLANFTFYNNQHLELIPAVEASRQDKIEAQNTQVLNVIEQDKKLDAWAADDTPPTHAE